jgi:hypothetical protein
MIYNGHSFIKTEFAVKIFSLLDYPSSVQAALCKLFRFEVGVGDYCEKKSPLAVKLWGFFQRL